MGPSTFFGQRRLDPVGELPEHPDRPIDGLGRAEEDGDARLGSVSTSSLLFSSLTATTRSGSSSRTRRTSIFLVPPTFGTFPTIRGGRVQ